MGELIIIAGPQAAGKSTSIAHLCEQCQSISPLFRRRKMPLLFPLQESRQIVIHKHMLLGAIFMTLEHELEIIACDFGRMDALLSRTRDHLTYIDECNIFTIAHATAHGVVDVARYWEEYLSRLRRLKAKVVFLDLPPDISWERRRQKYERRLVYFPKRQHKDIMRRYRKYLDSTYEHLREMYELLPFPKERIVSDVSEQDTVQKSQRINWTLVGHDQLKIEQGAVAVGNRAFNL